MRRKITHEQYLEGLKMYNEQWLWTRRRRVDLNYTAKELAKALHQNVYTIQDYDKRRQGYDRRTGKPTRAFMLYCDQLERLEPNAASRGFKHRGPSLPHAQTGKGKGDPPRIP